MGSLPNLHELGRDGAGDVDHHYHHQYNNRIGAGGALTQEEKQRALHRHSGHCKIAKARSNGHGSKIVYDDFMLEQMAAYSPISSRSTRNLAQQHVIRRRDSMNSSIGATSVRRLIAVVRNTSGRSGPVYSRRVLIRNLLLLCSSHLLITATFLPFMALQGSVSVWVQPLESEVVPLTINSGSLFLALLHAAAALASPFTPALVQKLGTNILLATSYVGFCAFYAAHLYPVTYILIPAYIALGLLLGSLTLARVSFLMTLSGKLSYAFAEEDDDAKSTRRTCVTRRVARAFQAAHDFGLMIGSVLAAILITYTISASNSAAYRDARRNYTTPNCSVAMVTDSQGQAGNCTTDTGTSLALIQDYNTFLDAIFDVDESGDRLCGSQACPTAYVLASNATYDGYYFHVLPQTTVAVLATVYTGCAFAALLITAFGLNRIRMYIYQDPLERPEGLAALRAVRESFKDVRLQLAAPLSFFIGLEQAFMYADFGKSYVVCTLGIHRLNLVFLCMGLLQSVAACTLSMLLRTIRRYYVVAVGFTFHACLLMVQMVWKPIGDDPALFYVISAAWGVCNAIWEMLSFTLLTGLYSDNWEPAFANTALYRHLGLAVAFASHGLLCNYVKLYLLAFFMLAAAAPFAWLEVKLESMRKVKNVSRL